MRSTSVASDFSMNVTALLLIGSMLTPFNLLFLLQLSASACREAARLSRRMLGNDLHGARTAN
jgi:hypothetical protein